MKKFKRIKGVTVCECRSFQGGSISVRLRGINRHKYNALRKSNVSFINLIKHSKIAKKL